MYAKIITISENTVGLTRNILGEHGLSFYVECGDAKLVFDTGQTFSAAHNAGVLGIELAGLPIALSHGHYDHTGGLKHILEKTGPTRIYGHPDIFAPKYAVHGKTRYIGIPFEKEDLEAMGAQFDLSREAREIAPGIWLTGEVPRLTEFETPSSDLAVKTKNGMVTDPLLDDQALILKLDFGIFVILGCTHSGMINTLEHARKVTGEDRVIGVVGGTHLGFGGEDKLPKTIEALRGYDLEILGASHCTGLKAASVLATEFGNKFVFNNAGTVIEL